MTESIQTEHKLRRYRSAFIISLIAVIVLSIAYFINMGNINEIPPSSDEVNSLQNKVNQLETEKNNIQAQRDKLENDLDELKIEKNELREELEQLSSNYTSLQLNNEQFLEQYYEILHYLEIQSVELKKTENMLFSYCSIPEAFERTLNIEEINKVSSMVSSITEGAGGKWGSYKSMYSYVISEIKYLDDIDFPYIQDYVYSTIDGVDVILKSFNNETREYIQTPRFTLDYQRGDCEDQVLLLYAMMKSYMIDVSGNESRLYIAHIETLNGSTSLSLILPDEKDKICILDPARRYLTSRKGFISSKPATIELQEYLDHWSKTEKIRNIDLYDVQVINISYELIKSGTPDEVAIFLSNQ